MDLILNTSEISYVFHEDVFVWLYVLANQMVKSHYLMCIKHQQPNAITLTRLKTGESQ